MTTQANYAAAWKKLANAPVLAGMGVSKADFGMISFLREFKALIEGTLELKTKYASNELVQAVISTYEKKDAAPPEESGEGGVSAEQILAELRQIAGIVDAKASADEARGFKAFLYEIADRVANASGEGFFGTGEKVSDKERAYLGQLKTALGLN
jgi:hypothetical protein